MMEVDYKLSDWEIFREHFLTSGRVTLEELGDLWEDVTLQFCTGFPFNIYTSIHMYVCITVAYKL